jgi:hypothetical protein
VCAAISRSAWRHTPPLRTESTRLQAVFQQIAFWLPVPCSLRRWPFAAFDVLAFDVLAFDLRAFELLTLA